MAGDGCVRLLFLFCYLCCVACELNLPEDSPCITKGINGTCLNVFKCLTAAYTYLYRNAGYDYEKYDLPEFPDICSYKDTEPVVCCTDCYISDELTGKNQPDCVDLSSQCTHLSITEQLNSEFKELNDSTNNTKERTFGVHALRQFVVGPNGILAHKGNSIADNKCHEYFEKLPYVCRGYSKVTSISKRWHEEAKCHNFGWGVVRPAGGRDAEKWEFPHMALIGYGNDVESAQWLCGGTVISERYILTAAHCTSTRVLGNISFAALGLLKRTDPKENWKIYKIKSIISHPEYKAPSTYHDIALLETETEIAFGKDLLPACLNTDQQLKTNGQAAGWGRLGHRQALAETLQVVEIEAFEESECARIYKPYRNLRHGYDHEKQMCYGSHSEAIDTCEGDSGGPLQYNQDHTKCRYSVIGVTSNGKHCGILGSAGMYTRVSYYVPWIESIVWPEETQVKSKEGNQWLDKWLKRCDENEKLKVTEQDKFCFVFNYLGKLGI